MHISANEFYTTALKACIGAGVARGVAIDVASACAAVAHFEPLVLKALLDALASHNGGLANSHWQNQNDVWLGEQVHVFRDGPSVLDLADVSSASCVCMAHPLLLLALAYGRMGTDGQSYEFCDEQQNWICVSNWSGVRELADGSTRLWCRRSEQKVEKPIGHKLPKVTKSQWSQLEQYAKEILVPNDDTNRADAGAGLTDND